MLHDGQGPRSFQDTMHSHAEYHLGSVRGRAFTHNNNKKRSNHHKTTTTSTANKLLTNPQHFSLIANP
jgi:hypothetical protein